MLRLLSALWALAASLTAPARRRTPTRACAATSRGRTSTRRWPRGRTATRSTSARRAERWAPTTPTRCATGSPAGATTSSSRCCRRPRSARATGDDADEASALIDDAVRGMGGATASTSSTSAAPAPTRPGYGDAAGAGDVGRIVAEQVGDAHPRPGRPDPRRHPRRARRTGRAAASPSGWVVRRRPRRCGGGGRRDPGLPALATPAADRRPPARPGRGRPTTGPASRRTATRQDTVEDRAALAREDVTRLGEELDAADPPLTDPAVAAHVQAALDAYADASRRVDSLTRDDELRQLAAGHRVRPLAAGLRRGTRSPAPRRRRAGCRASSTPSTVRRSPTCRGRRPGARCGRSRSAGPASSGSPRSTREDQPGQGGAVARPGRASSSSGPRPRTSGPTDDSRDDYDGYDSTARLRHPPTPPAPTPTSTGSRSSWRSRVSTSTLR